LPNQQFANPMLGELALLASRFYRHKTHARSTNGFADGLSIRRVVLASADIWFDVRWRDQSNLVPIDCDRASPIMGGGAGFDADEARRKSRKEIGQLRSLKPSAHDNSTCRVNTVHLKDTFGEIETQRGNLHRGRLPLVAFSDDHILAHRCRSAGAVHPINSSWRSAG
jgi:hypothetical protein